MPVLADQQDLVGVLVVGQGGDRAGAYYEIALRGGAVRHLNEIGGDREDRAGEADGPAVYRPPLRLVPHLRARAGAGLGLPGHACSPGQRWRDGGVLTPTPARGGRPPPAPAHPAAARRPWTRPPRRSSPRTADAAESVGSAAPDAPGWPGSTGARHAAARCTPPAGPPARCRRTPARPPRAGPGSRC